MQEKIDESFSEINNAPIPLLPSYFKLIGFCLIILSILFLLIFKIKNIVLNVVQKQTLRYTSVSIFILGLVLIAWGKSKGENKLTLLIRLKSIIMAFLLGVFSIILKPLTNFLFGSSTIDVRGQDLVLSILITYFIFYLVQILAIKKKS